MVQQDKISMASIVKAIDQMLGYIPRSSESGMRDNSMNSASSEHAQAPAELLHSLPESHFPTPLEIQERYVDNPEQHMIHERDRWKQEGDKVHERASEMERKRAVAQARGSRSG